MTVAANDQHSAGPPATHYEASFFRPQEFSCYWPYSIIGVYNFWRAAILTRFSPLIVTPAFKIDENSENMMFGP
jgi:hypothetical protein